MDLYYQLGEYISMKITSAEWGDGVVDELAATIARQYPGMRMYTRPNLFRMRQFYEAYRGTKKVSALLRQLPWTHHLLILGHSKLLEERNFYLQAAITAKWTSRELERQLRTQAFCRRDPGATKVSAALEQLLLCATKDDEVVEYALARTTSPTLVAEYQTMLPTKALLRRKAEAPRAVCAACAGGSISTVIAGAAPGGVGREPGQTNRGRRRSVRREGVLR